MIKRLSEEVSIPVVEYESNNAVVLWLGLSGKPLVTSVQDPENHSSLEQTNGQTN